VKPRRLVIVAAANGDVRRRARYLSGIRGVAFGERFAVELRARLESIADTGAQLGTAVGDDPAVRSFGYDAQATVIARFAPGELRVLRIFFTGQDWARRPEGR
jgi:hypothetical protein